MFHRAHLTLTAWYLLLIMSISLIFSIAFYHSSTRQIQQLIDRIQQEAVLDSAGLTLRPFMNRPRNFPTLEELVELKQRSFYTLLYVNAFIFIAAGGAGYFLAGRTLKPIKKMVDEQNEFIANASHEFRTPLATLQAEMEAALLEQSLSSSETKKLIKSNLEELHSLQSLTNNLLRLTQTETPNNSVEQSITSVNESVSLALKRVSALASKKKVKIESELVDAPVVGENNEVAEILIVLLDNAIKYGPAKSLINIASHVHPQFVSISVADQGMGITEDDLPHIFERFYRADKSRSQAEGFGLGLSIAHQIARRLGGDLLVSSQVGKGSVFTLKLPRA